MARGSKKDKGKVERIPEAAWNAGIYARLSVDYHNQKNESIEAQVQVAENYINQSSDIVLAGCYTDLGETGTDFQRKGFGRLMDDVRRRKINCVIVKDFSRFGRNYIETGNYMEKIFPFFQVRFISVSDGYDSHRPQQGNDILATNLKNIVNELYARDCAQKVRAVKKLKLEQGCYVGGAPPYGYSAKRVDGKKILIPEEGASDVVRAIFALFCKGKSVSDIISWLYGAGVHRPSEYRRTGHVQCVEGEAIRQWSSQTIRAMLTNPVYIGTLAQIKEGEKRYRIGEPCSVGPDGVVLAEHAHQPIVGEDLFYGVSTRLEGVKKKGIAGKKAPEDIYKGIICCGECASRLKRTCASNARSYQVSVRTYSYGCPNIQRIDSLRCGSHFISSNMVDRIVLEALQKAIALAGAPWKAWQGLNRRQQGEREKEVQKKITEAQGRLKKLGLELSSLYRKYKAGSIAEEAFFALKAEKEQEKKNVEKELRREIDRVQHIKKVSEEFNQFIRRLCEGEKGIKLDGLAVRCMVEKIVIYKDRRVELRFHFRD